MLMYFHFPIFQFYLISDDGFGDWHRNNHLRERLGMETTGVGTVWDGDKYLSPCSSLICAVIMYNIINTIITINVVHEVQNKYKHKRKAKRKAEKNIEKQNKHDSYNVTLCANVLWPHKRHLY